MIRLYVIDDHFLIIEGFFSSFDLESEEFLVVGGSLTVRDALNKIQPENVDIIILDLFINNTDPVLNFQAIHQQFQSIPIVILTHEDSQTWQVEMFRLGIMAYINKGDSKEVMKQRLFRVSEGEAIIPQSIAKILISEEHLPIGGVLDSVSMSLIKDLSNGLTIKQIAMRFCQSESNIEKKLNKLRISFQAKTNIELVCKILNQFEFRLQD